MGFDQDSGDVTYTNDSRLIWGLLILNSINGAYITVSRGLVLEHLIH